MVALADASGAIQERFVYSLYGQNLVLDGNFSVDSDGKSDYDWEYRFTSREFDSETGLSSFWARYWHPDLGRFIGRGPLGYIDGESLYAGYFVPGAVDPLGLEVQLFGQTWVWPWDPNASWNPVTNAWQYGAASGQAFAGTATGAIGGAGTGSSVGAVVGSLAGPEGTAAGFLGGAASGAGAGAVGGFFSAVFADNVGDTLAGAGISGPINGAIAGLGSGLGVLASEADEIAAMLQAGTAMDREGLTRAGRALQKHGNRKGSVFPRARGTNQQINEQGQQVLDGILNSTKKQKIPRPQGGYDIWDGATGRGVRYDCDGTMRGFLDP